MRHIRLAESSQLGTASRKPPTLGVALITLNAATHLAQCLEAVSFADQIVVVDSGSQDETLEIAARYNAEVFEHREWLGFGIQKNRAVSYLSTDWILLIDADEIVSPPLAESIRLAVTADQNRVYSLDRVSSFCGQWVQHSGWRPDYVARLFARDKARFSDDRVHERLVFEGQATPLSGTLLHYSYDDIDTVIRKLDSYSAAGARQRYEKGEHTGAGLGKAVRRGLWAFVRTYILKKGFLDGRAGFMIAALNAQTVYYRFLRLGELQQQTNSIKR